MHAMASGTRLTGAQPGLPRVAGGALGVGPPAGSEFLEPGRAHETPSLQVFSPAPEELARYARLIAAVEAGQATGSGAVLFEGEMEDEAVATTARRALGLPSGHRTRTVRERNERR